MVAPADVPLYQLQYILSARVVVELVSVPSVHSGLSPALTSLSSKIHEPTNASSAICSVMVKTIEVAHLRRSRTLWCYAGNLNKWAALRSLCLPSPTKTPAALPKICRFQKFDLTGSRLPDFCGVGKVFVPLKLDALETAPMRLNGQNRFHALFCRLKSG